ncbi:MAG: T9SS type A sorting domain-containing protein [Bacteroides sp.]|nr:T9SS type A sorting domain-containing protein [Bacteroides sp.]
MKRIQTLLLFVVFLSAMASAQTQLENPGFEQWEDLQVSDPDTIREPVDWSSLKDSDDPALSSLAPVVCFRSQDAHTGNYSIKLLNIQSFIVANGVATNGRMHPNINTDLAFMYTDPEDGQWNTPFTGRPDSLVGWIKYAPQENDTLQIQALLHQGYGSRPDPDYMENWIGEAVFETPVHSGGEWVRFSVPFNYMHPSIPEYILVVLNSGNGFSPVVGSALLVDDLEMIYNTPQSNLSLLMQSEGFLYVVDNRQILLKDLDHSLFQDVQVYDISGKLLWTSELTSDQINIAPAQLNKGLYLVKLSGKNRVFTQKVVLR